MTELLLLAIGASLVNNFVLTQFLGLCPFVGVSRRFEAAAGMALATLFVLTVASGLSFALWHWVLQPLGLEYLRTLAFILLIAGVVQFTELMVRATSPLLHQVLGIFLPLITTNCAVLGVALRYGHACSSELDFLRAALPEAEVTRIAHRINGGHVCAYLVAPIPAPQ